MEPIPFPPPTSGVIDSVPKVSIQSPYCENLLNFDTTIEGVALRNGDSVYKKYVNANAAFAARLCTYGDSKLFAAFYDTSDTKMKFLDVDAGTIAYSTAAAGSSAFYPQYFNGYLFNFNSGAYAPGVYFDGTAWGTIGYTGSGFSPENGNGNSYNSRNYIIQNSSQAYWYSGISAVSGALTKVDLASVAKTSAYLSNIVNFTLSDTTTTISIQTFIFADGNILFYQGTYPDAGGDNWKSLGRAKIGQLVSINNSTFSYQGDVIILCDSGIVSLRDLFTSGYQSAVSLSINNNIQKTWAALIKVLRAGNGIIPVPAGPICYQIKGVWDSLNSRIVITLPETMVSGAPSSNTFFVFDAITQGWSFHRSASVSTAFGSIFNDVAFYKNKIILLPDRNGQGNVVTIEKEGSSGFTDRSYDDSADRGYSFELKSAPLADGRAYVQKAEGLDVILETDMYDITNFNFIQDFGVLTTANQKIPNPGTGVRKPNVNMGIEGSYIQYKISGTTTTGKTTGLKIYGVNVWRELGTNPR